MSIASHSMLLFASVCAHWRKALHCSCMHLGSHSMLLLASGHTHWWKKFFKAFLQCGYTHANNSILWIFHDSLQSSCCWKVWKKQSCLFTWTYTKKRTFHQYVTFHDSLQRSYQWKVWKNSCVCSPEHTRRNTLFTSIQQHTVDS